MRQFLQFTRLWSPALTQQWLIENDCCQKHMFSHPRLHRSLGLRAWARQECLFFSVKRVLRCVTISVASGHGRESSGSISGDVALHLTLRRMATSLLQNTWVDPEEFGTSRQCEMYVSCNWAQALPQKFPRFWVDLSRETKLSSAMRFPVEKNEGQWSTC